MKTISVVIIEDDPRIAEIQHRFVERIENFQVVGIAHSTRDAQDITELLQPDLLLLDIHFPEGNGLDFLRKIRAEHNKADVILITAAKEVSTLTEAMHCGVFDYILKPLIFERLQQTLLTYYNHRLKLEELQTLNQQDVDHLIPKGGQALLEPVQARLPKGIDGLTLNKVRDHFQQHPSEHINAEEMGDAIGTSRTTARRYLEYLVTEDEISADVSYGGVGRPERRYKAKQK